MEWTYLSLVDGYLVDDDGDRYCDVMFQSAEQADAYLVENDLRATIR